MTSTKRSLNSYIKNTVRIILVVLFILCISGTTASASSSKVLTKDELLGLSSDALLQYLESNGLELPSDYAAHRYAAEEFVSTYVPLIVQGDINWTTASFGYYQSNVLLERIGIVLDNLNLLEAPSSTSRYTLQNSTVYGAWNNSYSNYNCYAYAIGQSGTPWPGYFSGNAFSITLSVSDMADNVLADLGSLGNWGYKVNTKPTVMPDSYFKLICIRKADNDFHFMKAPSSVNTWLHKPGSTWPLKWNYSSPNYCIWSGEYVTSDGVAHASNTYYTSSVIYILYKAYGAPGIQPPSNKK